MGSSPICDRGFLCCSNPGMSAPKSDLFVPQISLKIKKKTTQKKNKIIENIYFEQKKRSRSHDHRAYNNK